MDGREHLVTVIETHRLKEKEQTTAVCGRCIVQNLTIWLKHLAVA